MFVVFSSTICSVVLNIINEKIARYGIKEHPIVE